VDKDNSKLPLRENIKKATLCLIVIALISASDQLSKLWVRAHLAPWESVPITNRLSLIYIENTGSAFGLLANQAFLLIIISVAALLFILLFLRYLSPGCVTDFIYFRLWGDFHWPAFNVADAAIVVGVFVLIYSFYKSGVFRKAYESNDRPQD